MSAAPAPDWELDFYSRPILEPDGKKRWELLIRFFRRFLIILMIGVPYQITIISLGI